MKISELDLEPAAINFLKSEGYEKLFEPQAKAVKAGLFDDKKNILVTIPTASGKTLIAMLATLSHLLKNKTKVVYLSPLRALTSEKYNEFKKLEKLNLGRQINVAISTGDSKEKKVKLKDADVIFLTNESMDANLAFNPEWVDNIGLVISDEIHLIGDEFRGATLEIILTRLKSSITFPKKLPRIIGLSATISNSDELADWLNCKLINSDFRRVPLSESVYHRNIITNQNGVTNEGNLIRKKNLETGELEVKDRHEKEWLGLGLDTIDNGDQCLIFAMTRKNAVAWARESGNEVKKILTENQVKELKKISMKILPKAKHDTTKLIKELANAVENGTAFHHAGLDQRCRTIVEDEYKNRRIKLLTATPTLAAGVNLPARRVIIPNLMRFTTHGMDHISILEYKQMCGRAGRPQYDDEGESIIIAKKSHDEVLEKFVKGIPEPLKSQTLLHDSTLRINLLTFIYKINGDFKNIIKFFSQTFAAHQQNNPEEVENKIKEQIKKLQEYKVINQQSSGKYKTSEFGKKVFELRIDPETAFEMSGYIMNLSSGRYHTFGILYMITHLAEFNLQYDLPPKFYNKMEYHIKENQSLYKEQFNIECYLCHGTGEDDHEEECVLCEGSGREEGVNPKTCNLSLLIIYEWIYLKTYEEMSNEIDTEPGDIYYIRNNARTLLNVFTKLVEFWKGIEIKNGREQITTRYTRLITECENLNKRIHYGVPQNYLDLVDLNQIARIRAKILYHSKYNLRTKSDLKEFLEKDEQNVKKLAAIDKIGIVLAKSIKSQVEKKVK